MLCTDVKVDKDWIYAHIESAEAGSMDVKLSRTDKDNFELHNITGNELSLRLACFRLLELCEQSGGQLASIVEV